MEVLTIQEYKYYQDNLRNVMIMNAKVCEVWTGV